MVPYLVIGVQEVPEADTHRYGIIDPLTKNGRQYEVKKFVPYLVLAFQQTFSLHTDVHF
jgi:hypothetical protein